MSLAVSDLGVDLLVAKIISRTENTIYASELFDVIKVHLATVHCYATQCFCFLIHLFCRFNAAPFSELSTDINVFFRRADTIELILKIAITAGRLESLIKTLL